MKKRRLYATLTLIGPDSKGVVARFTQLLFRLGANIEGLEEQVTRSQFSMNLLASWDCACDQKKAIAALRKEAAAVRLECTVRFARSGPQRVALLVTRETHVLEALLGAVRKKALPCLPAVVIGSRPDPALEALAKKAGVPFHHVDHKDRPAAEAEILGLLARYEAEFVVLARYMKILSPNFVWRWKHKIINIHPSLLPAFAGANAYRQAFEKGVRVFGVTAHLVTPQLDEGPILAQESAEVGWGEPLASIVKRGQALEAKCLLRAVKLYLTKRLDAHWARIYGWEP